MIKSYEDYLYYLDSDKFALRKSRNRPRLIGDDIWKFERLLRKTEYYNNCKKTGLWMPYVFLLKYLLYRKSIRLGFSIPLNVFGPGLSIAHVGTIIINKHASIGENCRIHVCVNIGTKAGFSDKAPVLGNNVYIGPGAKIFGEIRIPDNVAIGANAVVNTSFAEPGITIAGVPAKKISDNGSEGLLIRGTEMAAVGK